MTEGTKIWIRGIVQGVGFRPFVYGLAMKHDIKGWVRNTSKGVEIEAIGAQDELSTFIDDLQHKSPPLARIDEFTIEDIRVEPYTEFQILTSQPSEGDFIPISPDVSICVDCQDELFDQRDRRYRYPFINCTNCGPRFTIIKDIPYDRPKTTMSSFPLCLDCETEYRNPLDRRFHAQPVACPICGPHVWFEVDGIRLADQEDAIQTARSWIKNGKIIAIKGLGGFHLACDATDSKVVSKLRERKKRSDKPFALMSFDITAIENHCVLSDTEMELLLSRERPIVILEKKPESIVAENVTPYQYYLGVMLPYAPLHLLILEPDDDFPDMLVMTSGNLSDEPIAYLDDDAQQRLSKIADGFLMHNRPIHMRVDDSVYRIFSDETQPVRRSRGYAPDPIKLPMKSPHLLSTGPELKNTFCLSRDQYAFLSHHIGDMENFETLRSFETGITHFEKLFKIKPEFIACDMHPDYLATRYAINRSEDENLPLYQIQHHHAHLAACLVDNNWQSDEPVIGLCFDGTGYGSDGAIWGGEVLVGGYANYQRYYHLKYVPLPGGDLAIRKPARTALAHLWAAGIPWEEDYHPSLALCADERSLIHAQLSRQINAPLTSSMGRLFDAAAALIGLRPEVTYEGQAAIELESMAADDEMGYYPFDIQSGFIDPTPLWQELLNDWRDGIPIPLLSARFHNSIIEAAYTICKALKHRIGSNTVALSGGVWQNKYLYERMLTRLKLMGFNVLTHHQIPTNDGGIAIGQTAIAATAIHNEKG